MQNFLQTASNLWEHAKETIVDTVGMASDHILPESFIEDAQSKAILEKFDRISKQSQDILAKIQLLKSELVNLSRSFSSMSSSFQAIIPSQTEKDDSSNDIDIANIKASIEKYELFSKFLLNLTDNIIPTEIEKNYENIIDRIKSKSEERNQFSQSCLKAERIRKTIASSIESSPPDRLVELQHIEQDINEKVAALKQILTAESNMVEEEFVKARKNTLKMICLYEKKSFEQIEQFI